MIKKVVEIEVESDEAKAEISKLNESVKDLDETVKKSSKNTSESLKSIEKTSKSSAKAVKGVGLALKAIGIGLILKAFQVFSDVLSENQKVLDFTTTAFNFVSVAVSDLINNVKGVIDWFKKLGSAAVAVFKGQFGVAAVIVKDAINDLTDYVEVTVDAAEAITELGNRALIAAAQNRGLIEEYDRQAEKLRQIRDDDLRGIDERIEANNKLGLVLEEQEKAMLANADAIIRAAEAEFNRNKNIENEVALIEARNEKLAVLAQIEGFRSEQLINTNSLLRERNELMQADLDLINEFIEEGEQAEIDAEDRRLERLFKGTKKEKEEAEKRAEIAKGEAEAKAAAENMLVSQTRNALRTISLLFEKGTAASKAAALAEIAIGTGIGFIQALDIAQKSAKATGPAAAFAFPIFYASQIAAVLGAAGQAKAILSTSNARGGSSTAPSSSVSTPSAPQVQEPSFNLVGATGINQLSDVISQQTQAPVKAFVVSQDVTTGQQLDRSIVGSASIG